MTSTEHSDRDPGDDRPGGLGAAVERIARRAGIDLGSVSTTPGGTVGLASNRGAIGIFPLAGGEFRVALAGDPQPWAVGFSTDLDRVVAVADAWRRGATLAELRERFPFMEYTPLAQAYEDGDPVGFRWRTLIEDPALTALHPFLAAAYADDRLRGLLPAVSHLTLVRLFVDHRDERAGLVFAEVKGDGSWHVGSSATGGTTVTGSAGEAVALAAGLAGRAAAG